MKLPATKQKKLEKQGRRKSKSTPPKGGDAMGRLRQFEEQRGLQKTDVDGPGGGSRKKD
jgi:hypothetical protein